MYLNTVSKKERILINSAKNKILKKEKRFRKITDGEAIVYVLEDYIGDKNRRRKKRQSNN